MRRTSAPTPVPEPRRPADPDRPRRDAARPRRGWAWFARNMRSLPNRITFARLASLPVLWGMAFAGRPEWVGVGVGIAAATDVLDGWLSRARRQTSAFGSRLDSIADHLLTMSTVGFLALLRPEFFRAEAAWLVAWSVVALGVLGISLARARRWVDLHLITTKVAVFLGYLFAVWVLVTGTYHRVHFLATLAMMFVAAAEALLVILTRRRLNEHLGSAFLRRRR